MVLVSIFVVSILSGYFSSTLNPNVEQLSDEPSQAQSHGTHATSPGHVVFGQYISSDNCGHCSKAGGGSAAHHSIKETFPDEYVYVTYMSASYGDTDTARAGKVGPYNWVWSTSGAPDAYFGDRSDKNQGGANNQYTTYDSLFSSGGGMHPTVNDYGMEAAIYQNGNSYDVSISYVYTGTGTPAGNMKLYAALVDKDCTGYSYSSGIPHGYNCWMAWLTAGNTYKSKSAGTGNAFHSVTVSSTEESQSWSGIPTSVVPGGLDKAIVVAVLMSGNTVSVGAQVPTYTTQPIQRCYRSSMLESNQLKSIIQVRPIQDMYLEIQSKLKQRSEITGLRLIQTVGKLNSFTLMGVQRLNLEILCC